MYDPSTLVRQLAFAVDPQPECARLYAVSSGEHRLLASGEPYLLLERTPVPSAVDALAVHVGGFRTRLDTGVRERIDIVALVSGGGEIVTAQWADGQEPEVLPVESGGMVGALREAWSRAGG
jgi:hypothetical protein